MRFAFAPGSGSGGFSKIVETPSGFRCAVRRIRGHACRGSADSRRQGAPLPGRDLGQVVPVLTGNHSDRSVPPCWRAVETCTVADALPGRRWAVRPPDWTLPHGSPDLPAVRARRMAIRRHAAGGARAADRGVALHDLQLAASTGDDRHVFGAVCDLSRKQPGPPVCRLVHVLELRRGFARCVSRRAQTFQHESGLAARQEQAAVLMSHPGRVIPAEMAPVLRSSGPVRSWNYGRRWLVARAQLAAEARCALQRCGCFC